MTAHLIAIGDELLIGQVINTNASWLGERLTDIGVEVTRVTTLGDDRGAIVEAIRAAWAEAGLVVVTGGLGPTHDDVTKAAVADLFEVGLEFREDLFAGLRARYEVAGKVLSASNRSQAEVPVGFAALSNRVGTAPGLLKAEGARTLVVLPGVPAEMRAIMEDEVIPRLVTSSRLQPAVRKTLLTTGIAESALHDAIGDLSAWEKLGCRLAYLPSVHGVRLRLTGSGPREEEAGSRLAEFEKFVRGHAGLHVYGEGTDTLEEVVGRLLAARAWSIATAESCTGGQVASRLTDVPGSSSYMRGGVVAYDNAVKRDILGVSAAVLREDGAVSKSVVVQMAEGVRRVMGTEVGVSTSGIMGPTGGSESKPVGTVWLAVALPGVTGAKRIQTHHDRSGNKERAASAALDFIRTLLLQ